MSGPGSVFLMGKGGEVGKRLYIPLHVCFQEAWNPQGQVKRPEYLIKKRRAAAALLHQTTSGWTRTHLETWQPSRRNQLRV